MKRLQCTILTAILILSICASSGYATDFSTSVYALGVDELASITEIVGDREATQKQSGDYGLGGSDLGYTYQSDAVSDDMQAYIEYLRRMGFALQSRTSLSEPGQAILVALSKDPGFLLRTTLDWTEGEYRVYFIKYARTPNSQPVRDETDAEKQGRAAMEAESFEEALGIFDAALADQPDVAAYHGGRGEALLRLERYEESIGSLNTAIQLNPEIWKYYSDRGEAHYYLGQKEEALKDFWKTFGMGAEHTDVYINLVYALYWDTGDLQNAQIVCIDGLAAFPDCDYLWFMLGNINYTQGYYKAALYAYDMALSFGNITIEEYIPVYDEVKQNAN